MSNSESNFEVLVADVSNTVNVEMRILKNKFRELTLAKIAHELKNPINTINLLTKSMQDKYNLINESQQKNYPNNNFAEPKHTLTNLLDPKNNINLNNSSDESSDNNENINTIINTNNISNIIKNKKITVKSSTSSNRDPVGSNNSLAVFQSKKGRNNTMANLNFISCLCDFLILLIEDLNSFVKMEEDNLVPKVIEMANLDLDEILNFCYYIFETRQLFDPNKKSLKVKKSFDPKAPKKIYTNSTKLKQVVLNLMSNAYKFTPAGEIKLITKMISENGQHLLRISIKDAGTGLTPEEQKLLFNPFCMIERNQSLNSQGSGLGLVIVKETLEALGSKIQCKSKINEGSTFYFDIVVPPQNNVECKDQSKNSSCETLAIDQFFFMNDNLMKEISKWNIKGI